MLGDGCYPGVSAMKGLRSSPADTTESFMTKLLFGIVIAMILISPALAGGGNNMDGDQTCKACPSWRSPASSDPPPWWLPQSPPACHLVKDRIGTRRGHPVYQTRQVCG
jgi:hypothetical protein